MRASGLSYWKESALTISVRETFEMLIGSGALGFPWYRVDTHPADNIDQDTWVLAFTELDFGSSGAGIAQHVITHDDVVRSVQKIAGSDGNCVVDDAVRRECQELTARGPEAASFSADAADQVIQFAAFGKVIYR